MYILKKENQKLNEMSQHWINSGDELPFDVVIQSPEHLPPRAHILDIQTGKEIGQFLIPSKLPKTPEDIKDYKKGVSDEIKRLLFKWLPQPNKKTFRKLTNLETIVAQWSFSKK